jgi:hypothetical protein
MPLSSYSPIYALTSMYSSLIRADQVFNFSVISFSLEIALFDERICDFRREGEAEVRLPMNCTDALKFSGQSSTLTCCQKARNSSMFLGSTRNGSIAIDGQFNSEDRLHSM